MLPICVVLIPVVAALCLNLIPKDDRKRMNLVTMGALGFSALLAAVTAFTGSWDVTLWSMSEKLTFALRVDDLSRIYLVFISIVWVCVGFYSLSYNEHDHHARRFNIFFVATYGILMGLSMAKNAVTLYMFYEMMTLITVPLVVHTREKEAIAAGIKYLVYSVFGASAGLLGIFFLNHYGTTLDFTAGGVLNMDMAAGHEPLLMAIAFAMLLGFSVKAGMFPMHAWLPTAHPVAPAPASAVLSGVITKMGVLGVIRVMFYLFGVDFIRGTWVQTAFMTLTLITVFMGSLLALREKVFKKRLAYSSVSQLSYILFGLSTMSPLGFAGAVLHIIGHSFMKNTLFMTAGAVIHNTGKTRADEVTGVGLLMPRVMTAFTIVSLGLIGIPPTAGFVSKWYLAQGALSSLGSAAWIGPVVLLCSALMTAGYLLTITISAFFPGDRQRIEGKAASPYMWIPMLVLAVLSVLVGMFPGALLSFVNGIAATIL